VFFDEKSSGIKLLNASSGLLQDGPFDIVSQQWFTCSFFHHFDWAVELLFLVSTKPSTFVPESTRQSIYVSTRSSSPSTEIVPSSDRPSVVDINSPFSCLPRWDAKTIEVVGPDVGDVSSGRQTRVRSSRPMFL
jgi:hypothetical protein